MKRLLFLAALAAGFSATLIAPRARAADMPFDFEVLRFRAKTLAAKPYELKPSPVPKALANLTYDQYRDIRFDPNRPWWRKERLPVQLQFFHPVFIFHETVQVSEIVDHGEVHPIEFTPNLFDYG